MDALSSVTDVVTVHDCLNPVFDPNIQQFRTSPPEKRRRTHWSAEDTLRFRDHMNSMDNAELGELFGRSRSEIVNKRRVEGRKEKRRLNVG
jgi:hypothetical protein